MTKPPRILRVIVLIGCLIVILSLVWHFARVLQIRKYFGGKENVQLIASPDDVRIYETLGYLQRSTNASPPYDFFQEAGDGVVLPRQVTQALGKILLTPSSYEMNPFTAKEATPLPELMVQFRRDGRLLELFVCFESADVFVKRDGGVDHTLDMRYARVDLEQLLRPFVKHPRVK